MKFTLLVFSLIVFSNISHAACSDIQGDAKAFKEYLAQYEDFEANYDSLDDRTRWTVMKESLQINIKMLQKVAGDTQITMNPWTDMKFILDFSFGLQNANDERMTLANLNKMTSLQHMRNGLLQFKLAIQEKLEVAQVKFSDCPILERK